MTGKGWVTWLALAAALGALAGCATKTYGRMSPLTDFERQTMTCREIALEQARVQGFLDQVYGEAGQFDGRAVLAFLGDFGIGNSLELDAATKSAYHRRMQLDYEHMNKQCGQPIADGRKP